MVAFKVRNKIEVHQVNIVHNVVHGGMIWLGAPRLVEFFSAIPTLSRLLVPSLVTPFSSGRAAGQLPHW